MKKLPVVVPIICLTVGIAIPLIFHLAYFYFAAYVILQYIILSTAWNILGGYTGYVNFGVGAFFALGAYTAAMLILNLKTSLPVAVVLGGLVSAILGMGIGCLTLRLRGVFFAIATLALAVVLETVIVSTPALGGARGLYVHRPKPVAPFSTYPEFLYVLMVLLALLTIFIARYIERSWIGRGLTAIRDNEEAAECQGVPVFKLKLLAATISGFFMGVAGAPFPYYITYLEPRSTMGMDVTVNSLAMALIGGTTTWSGPVIGALLLGTLQQAITVTVSSAFNLLIVGLLLVGFVILAPDGIVGLVRRYRKKIL